MGRAGCDFGFALDAENLAQFLQREGQCLDWLGPDACAPATLVPHGEKFPRLPALPKGVKDWEANSLKKANASIALALNRVGVPYADAGYALKGQAEMFEKKDFNAAGYQAIAKVADEAIEHVNRYVRNRR